MFKLYDCKVRIGGSVLNEVPKSGVTAPEIEVLRAIHGSDAVAGIKENGEVKRSDREERARLDNLYANPSLAMGESLAKKKRLFTELFGHVSNPLPKEAELVAGAHAEDEEFEEPDAIVEAAPAPKRTRIGKESPAFAE